LSRTRSDDRDYPSSRTPQATEPIIPLPPNVNGAQGYASTSTPKIPPKLKLTPGEAGVPPYKGDEYQPLTRTECKSYYAMSKPKPIPKVGEPLTDAELIKALTKLPDKGDPHINDKDRTMSEFVMDQIDQCFTIPDDFIYEVMVEGTKRYRTIHGDAVYAKVAFASAGLYQLLDIKMIARVGDYYYSLRMLPEKKSATYEEYIPNRRYSYSAGTWEIDQSVPVPIAKREKSVVMSLTPQGIEPWSSLFGLERRPPDQKRARFVATSFVRKFFKVGFFHSTGISFIVWVGLGCQGWIRS
jgi:hypothetical protein